MPRFRQCHCTLREGHLSCLGTPLHSTGLPWRRVAPAVSLCFPILTPKPLPLWPVTKVELKFDAEPPNSQSKVTNITISVQFSAHESKIGQFLKGRYFSPLEAERTFSHGFPAGHPAWQGLSSSTIHLEVLSRLNGRKGRPHSNQT